MPVTIHCVRHAQGFHNLGVQFHRLPDPKLTPVGHEQCKTAKTQTWPDQTRLSLITASPLSRTLQTATLIFSDALSNGKAQTKILALPDAQETSDFPCDTGSDADVLRSMSEELGWPVDVSLVKDGWNAKTIGSRYAPSSEAIKVRARDARVFLREKARELVAGGDEDPEIVLVTHGGYLHYFTEDWENSNKLLGTGWENCESRSYVFENGEDDPDARLVETGESRKRRGLDYPMFDKEKQMELFHQCLRDWNDQGLEERKCGSEESDPTSGDRPIEVAA